MCLCGSLDEFLCICQDESSLPHCRDAQPPHQGFMCGSLNALLCICQDESSLPHCRDAEPPRRSGIRRFRRIRKVIKKKKKAVMTNLCLWCSDMTSVDQILCGVCAKMDEGMDYADHCSDRDQAVEGDDADHETDDILVNSAAATHLDNPQLLSDPMAFFSTSWQGRNEV